MLTATSYNIVYNYLVLFNKTTCRAVKKQNKTKKQKQKQKTNKQTNKQTLQQTNKQTNTRFYILCQIRISDIVSYSDIKEMQRYFCEIRVVYVNYHIIRRLINTS